MKAEKVMVRMGFSDQVLSLKDSYDNNKEICSCESYVVGYEDENGRKCTENGTYLDNKDESHVFFS